jgi:hypothetical protein
MFVKETSHTISRRQAPIEVIIPTTNVSWPWTPSPHDKLQRQEVLRDESRIVTLYRVTSLEQLSVAEFSGE